MRWATCKLHSLYIAGSAAGGHLTVGSRVDLDAEVSPGVTYEQALGQLVAHFTIDAAPARPVRGNRTSEPAGVEASTQKDE